MNLFKLRFKYKELRTDIFLHIILSVLQLTSSVSVESRDMFHVFISWKVESQTLIQYTRDME